MAGHRRDALHGPGVQRGLTPGPSHFLPRAGPDPTHRRTVDRRDWRSAASRPTIRVQVRRCLAVCPMRSGD